MSLFASAVPFLKCSCDNSFFVFHVCLRYVLRVMKVFAMEVKIIRYDYNYSHDSLD